MKARFNCFTDFEDEDLQGRNKQTEKILVILTHVLNSLFFLNHKTRQLEFQQNKINSNVQKEEQNKIYKFEGR